MVTYRFFLSRTENQLEFVMVDNVGDCLKSMVKYQFFLCGIDAKLEFIIINDIGSCFLRLHKGNRTIDIGGNRIYIIANDLLEILSSDYKTSQPWDNIDGKDFYIFMMLLYGHRRFFFHKSDDFLEIIFTNADSDTEVVSDTICDSIMLSKVQQQIWTSKLHEILNMEDWKGNARRRAKRDEE